MTGSDLAVMFALFFGTFVVAGLLDWRQRRNKTDAAVLVGAGGFFGVCSVLAVGL